MCVLKYKLYGTNIAVHKYAKIPDAVKNLHHSCTLEFSYITSPSSKFKEGWGSGEGV